MVLEKTWVPWTARKSNQSIRKSVLNVHWKDWCWSWSSNSLATCYEEPTHWKRPWCWERLKAGGEGDDSVWDGWMASPIQWKWVWVNSRSLWWTGRPGVVQFMESQRVRHHWVTELNWITPKLEWLSSEAEFAITREKFNEISMIMQIVSYMLSCNRNFLHFHSSVKFKGNNL